MGVRRENCNLVKIHLTMQNPGSGQIDAHPFQSRAISFVNVDYDSKTDGELAPIRGKSWKLSGHGSVEASDQCPLLCCSKSAAINSVIQLGEKHWRHTHVCERRF